MYRTLNLSLRNMLKFQHESNTLCGGYSQKISELKKTCGLRSAFVIYWFFYKLKYNLENKPKCCTQTLTLMWLCSDPESWCEHAVYCTMLYQIKLGIIYLCEIFVCKKTDGVNIYWYSLVNYVKSHTGIFCSFLETSFPKAVKFEVNSVSQRNKPAI